MDTVVLDVSCNSIQSVPAEISQLSDTLQTLNLRCANIPHVQNLLRRKCPITHRDGHKQVHPHFMYGVSSPHSAAHVLNAMSSHLAMRWCSHDPVEAFPVHIQHTA